LSAANVTRQAPLAVTIAAGRSRPKCWPFWSHPPSPWSALRRGGRVSRASPVLSLEAGYLASWPLPLSNQRVGFPGSIFRSRSP